MSLHLRSKKMALFDSTGARRHSWTDPTKMVRIGPMASPKFPLDRRETDRRIGRGCAGPDLARGRRWPRRAPRWRCRPKPAASLCVRTPRPRRSGRCKGPNFGSSAARPLEVVVRQRAAGAGRALNWRGIDGVPAAEPLTAARRSQPAARKPCNCRCATPGPSCATSGCSATARRGRRGHTPLVVRESEPVAVDRDEVLLIEEWRLRAGRHRDRARRRPEGHHAGLYDQRPDFIRTLSPDQRAPQAPLYQRLPTLCYCNQN